MYVQARRITSSKDIAEAWQLIGVQQWRLHVTDIWVGLLDIKQHCRDEEAGSHVYPSDDDAITRAEMWCDCV